MTAHSESDSDPVLRDDSIRPGRGEIVAVAMVLTVFLLVNLLTASRYPFVWIDEVMYTDPAINLVSGRGFTSTAWYAQPSTEFWAGNVPMHSLLLAGWIKLAGFSPTSVRSINFVYFVLSSWLLWRACLRLRLVIRARERLLLLLLLAGGYGMIFSYRSGRPDCLAMLNICAMPGAFGLKREWLRFPLLGLLGLIAPWVGLQLLPLLGVAGAMLAIGRRREMWRPVFVVWLGVAAGAALLLLLYQSQGVLEGFLASTRQHTFLGVLKMLLNGQFRHSNFLPKDFSFVILFPGALVLVWNRWRQGQRALWSPPLFWVVLSVVVTIALVLSGKFPTYYGWMTYLPLCLGVCSALSRQLPARWLKTLVWGVAILAIFAGMGLHLVAAAWNWSDRDYLDVQKLVQKSVNANDTVMGEHAVFYAAKAKAGNYFAPYYLPAMLPREKASVTVLIVSPVKLDEYVEAIGGKWAETGEAFTPKRRGFLGRDVNLGFLTMQDYLMKVYRRVEGPAIPHSDNVE